MLSIDKKFIDRLVERKGKGYYYHLLQVTYAKKCGSCKYAMGRVGCIGMIGWLKIC